MHINFVDWLPLVFSFLGMIIINSIEKTRLSADSFSYSGSGVAWKARVVLFLGFASLAGGMAGGVTVLVLKYVVPQTVLPTLYMGIANVLANGLVMLRYVYYFQCVGGLRMEKLTWSSAIVLWISQNMEDEYSYNLSL